MPRKPRPETALTIVRAGRGDRPGELEHDDDQDDDEEAACLLCTLADNDDEEPLRDRLARAIAYGELALAAGHGLSTCPDCHELIVGERRDMKRELR